MNPNDTRDEAAWLAWRKEGVTATDVADAAAGTYGGMYGVVCRKRDLVPKQEQTPAMARGHRWQFPVADAIHALTGLFVVGEEQQVECATDHRWRATVDGFLSETPTAELADVAGVLEVKTTGVGVRPDRDRWVHQVQWQLLVTGLHRGVIAHAVIDDTDDTCVSLRITPVEADPAHQALLMELATEIAAHVTAGTLPEPDDGSALDVVKQVYRNTDPTAVPVDLTDLSDLLERYAQLQAAIKQASTEKDGLEAILRDRIGEGQVGSTERWRVSVSRPAMTLSADAERDLLEQRPELSKRVLDRDLAKREAAELYESLRQPIGARRMTIKQLKGTEDE